MYLRVALNSNDIEEKPDDRKEEATKSSIKAANKMYCKPVRVLKKRKTTSAVRMQDTLVPYRGFRQDP